MSIEKDLTRIADALEALLKVASGNPVPVAEAPVTKTKAKKAEPVVEDSIPGVEDVTPVEEVAEERTFTGAQLRELAQKYIAVAGNDTNALVTFIRDGVCKIFNPTEPKLIKIPDAKCAEAAGMIENWCKKKKITLPVEV